MVVFCIEQDKGDKLAEYLSDIAQIFYKNDLVESLFMNTYLIHKQPFDYTSCPIMKDGINIDISFISDDYENYENIVLDELKSLKNKIYDELNVNIIFNIVESKILEGENKAFEYQLCDGEILFDKTNRLITIKNTSLYTNIKYGNSVRFEPELNLRKEFK